MERTARRRRWRRSCAAALRSSRSNLQGAAAPRRVPAASRSPAGAAPTARLPPPFSKLTLLELPQRRQVLQRRVAAGGRQAHVDGACRGVLVHHHAGADGALEPQKVPVCSGSGAAGGRRSAVARGPEGWRRPGGTRVQPRVGAAQRNMPAQAAGGSRGTARRAAAPPCQQYGGGILAPATQGRPSGPLRTRLVLYFHRLPPVRAPCL